MSIIRIPQNCKNLVTHKEITWNKARPLVIRANPELAQIIDELNPSPQHTLILATYPYGTNIRDKGQSYFPAEDKNLATLDEQTISQNLRDKLDYSPSPLAFIADKSVEIYVETPEGRTIPLKLFKPGVTIGVWEILKRPLISIRHKWDWSISSGARTLFLLPKITNQDNHAKLQRAYSTRVKMSRNIFDHTKIFTGIFNYHAEKNPWTTRVIFFTRKWLEPQLKNIGWVKLKEYWAREAWHQMHYWSNKIIFDFTWEDYLAELSRQRIKLKPYFLDTVKQLISIACGVVPGFRPADESEQVAPTKIVQRAYVEDYGLKDYAPIIMQPDFLSLNSSVKAVYYSLQFPTLPEKPFEFEKFSSVLKIIRELKDYMDVFLIVLARYPKSAFPPIYDLLEHIQFDYFHTEKDPQGNIQHTSAMPEFDPGLSDCDPKYGKREFPENAPFFRGCVRISFKT